jgi:hypothetical protein
MRGSRGKRSGPIAAAAGAAAQKIARRSAGPPTPVVELSVWVFIGLTAYACFILFPAKYTGPFHPRTLSGLNDLANAASHMFMCATLWPVMDLMFRGTAICLMAPVHAARYAAFMFGSEAADDAATANRSATLNFVAAVLRPIRALFVDTSHDAEPLPPAGSRPPAFIPGYWTHREVTVLVGVMTAVTIMVFTYRLYIVPRRQYLVDKRRKIEELQASKNQAQIDQADDLEALPEPSYVPVLAWMLLWSVGYASAFQWAKAMPVMVGQVYPTVICLLIGFCMLIP